MLQPIEALIGNADQLVGLIAILRKSSDAVVHADANAHLQVRDGFFKNGSDTAAQGQGLGGIGLRKEKGKFIAADTKCGVRGAQSFFQRGSSGAQDFIAARMAVLVVDFLEAMQIENDEAERLAVTAGAIQFFFEGFAEEPAIVEAGKGIGDGIQLQLL